MKIDMKAPTRTGEVAKATRRIDPVDSRLDPDPPSDPASGRTRKRRTPRPITPSLLERWALAYLNRYATSAQNLRAVLRRKAIRNDPEAQAKIPDLEAWIDELVRTLEGSGYVDDGTYALGLATRLHGRGASVQLIRARLREKGLPSDHIEAALERTDREGGDFAAALRYARRRGFGPFRADPELRSQRRERDLAAFARAGFGYGVAIRILDAESAEELEEG
jgi:regulatory protein